MSDASRDRARDPPKPLDRHRTIQFSIALNAHLRKNVGMRLLGLPLAVATFLLFNSAIANAAPAPSPSSPELHIFSGEVTSVNPAAKTFTITSGGKSFVFHVVPETKFGGYNGRVTFEAMRRGNGATVAMRLGPGGLGIATKVFVRPNALGEKVTALYSAKTIQGETVTGNGLANYVVYEPPGDAWSYSAGYEGKRRGAMFLLKIQPDGTVGDVKAIGTLGYSDLNERAIRYLKRWKFKPHTLVEVRMPLIYFLGG